MSDDFDRLRRTMSELAEHGGSTDLYDRTLHASRRLTRRRNALAGGAVAAAVLALGVPVALAGWDRTAPPPPAATPLPSPPPAPPSPSSPSPTIPSPTSPSPTSPSSSSPAPGASSRSVTPRGTSKPPAPGCPVSAATLLGVADLPAGWRIKAADITCVQGWADAGPTAPTEAEQGDGVILFRYTAGKWKKVTEGSAIECASHGVPESVGRRLSACYYE
jgi:hypothetical protein